MAKPNTAEETVSIMPFGHDASGARIFRFRDVQRVQLDFRKSHLAMAKCQSVDILHFEIHISCETGRISQPCGVPSERTRYA